MRVDMRAAELRAPPAGCRAFHLTRLAGGDLWSLSIRGAFPSRWCGNFSVNCFGVGIDIQRCDARRFGFIRWSAVLVLDAAQAASQPASMDFLRMCLRRPALHPAATEVRIHGFRLAPAGPSHEIAVEVRAPDRLGLLAVLLDRFEALGLVPSRIHATSGDGLARDHFRLTGQTGAPTRVTREELARCLAALHRRSPAQERLLAPRSLEAGGDPGARSARNRSRCAANRRSMLPSVAVPKLRSDPLPADAAPGHDARPGSRHCSRMVPEGRALSSSADIPAGLGRAHAWRRWLGDEWRRASGPAPAAPVTPAPAGGRPVGARYQVINELGRGGMGVVSRSLDRLTGRVVTLKQLRVPEPEDGRASSTEGRALLAREFQNLASLHHPNIISVLDYGFDEARQPYLVMDLAENALTILEAGADRSLAVQVDLLVQTLRALAYLHRCGILHRDLKPDNILVVGDRVKVLDFGFSITRKAVEAGDADWAGTPAYMAPEVLRGEAPSEHSDLYAVGMIAYELFTGRYPFDYDHAFALHRKLTTEALPRPEDPIDERLRPLLERLLAKDPNDRFAGADEVVRTLGTALDRSLSIETVTTRESFIQAAPLVGRERELETLRAALDDTARGSGSAWLLGGESGVGKSRLLDELRTQALVDGIPTVRGQAVSEGAGAFHPWRPIVSSLVLETDVADAEAEVLKTIVPDIARLLGRPVGDAPPVDAEAEQARLLFAVEELFRAQPQPLVAIVEDLQWAGSESLKLFTWLAHPVERQPLLLIGSFRDDEAPELPGVIGGAHLLVLERLHPDEIAQLGAAMIGPAALDDELRQLLERETEGIPFFIVEVVRALAESAGCLEDIGRVELPQRVLAGGIQKVVRRRLERVSGEDLGPLECAAVVGRELDDAVLRALHPALEVEPWASACAQASVLEQRDQRWRFAHDKLREQILDDLSPATRRDLHRRVAEAIEVVHPDAEPYVPALAHHWRMADEPAREAVYARRAGELSLRSGACQEAVAYLRRALHLLERGSKQSTPARGWLDPNRPVDPESRDFLLGRVENALCEAYYRLGDLNRCRRHAERALARFGQPVPSTGPGWSAALAREIGLRMLQRLLRVHSRRPGQALRTATEIGRAHLRLTDTYYYSLELQPILWSSLRVVNQCEPAGISPELAQGYILVSLLSQAARFDRLTETWTRRAIAIAERTGDERNLAWVHSRAGVNDLAECRWDAAESDIERARVLAERVGDLRLWEETRTQAGMLGIFTADFDRGLEAFDEVQRLCRRSGNRQIECWAHLGRGGILSRQGRDLDALGPLEAALRMLDESSMKTEAICVLGTLALVKLRSGDAAGAYECADRALHHVRSMRPVAYWLQPSLSATAEVFLTLIENDWGPDEAVRAGLPGRARQALRGVRIFARHMPLGRPHVSLLEGMAAWVEGREKRAVRCWQQTIEVAERLRMPWERARAHFELGRHLDIRAEGRSHHLHQASAWFARIGSGADAARVNEELTRSRAAVRGVS
jgi:tetratricopeptide (TPR) repeat protein